eukprot:COSAG05_NODE_272_length_12454_cov_1460.218085_4_plen_137_part_00
MHICLSTLPVPFGEIVSKLQCDMAARMITAGGCFSSGQWDKGSSNFTDNHCFVRGEPSYFNCNCNVSCTGWPETCTPCPVLRNNHYYQQNQTYVTCGNLTMKDLQARGMEVGSTVSPVPDADGIVKIVKAQLAVLS